MFLELKVPVTSVRRRLKTPQISTKKTSLKLVEYPSPSSRAIWARKTSVMRWVYLVCTCRRYRVLLKSHQALELFIRCFWQSSFCVYLDGKRKKQLSPVCDSRWDLPPQYQTFWSYKKGQWKMSSVTLSLILLWLSSTCGLWYSYLL